MISVCRLEKQKNPFDLILISKLTNLPLTIIGKGYLKKYILKFIKSIDAPVKIISKFSNNDLPDVLNNSTFYLSTSLFEGSPKSILEAMSCGLITIAYEAPGVNEILNNNNGILIRKSPYIANEMIRKLIIDNHKRKNIGTNARNYILQNNSFKKIMKKQDEIYFTNS